MGALRLAAERVPRGRTKTQPFDRSHNRPWRAGKTAIHCMIGWQSRHLFVRAFRYDSHKFTSQSAISLRYYCSDTHAGRGRPVGRPRESSYVRCRPSGHRKRSPLALHRRICSCEVACSYTLHIANRRRVCVLHKIPYRAAIDSEIVELRDLFESSRGCLCVPSR